jgi:hypothetical protein
VTSTLTAEAVVATERPGRYLVQLCQHVHVMAQTHPHMRARVEWTDANGVLDFGWGRCQLDAGEGVLTLHAEAPDAESLRRLQQRIAERLEQIGRRDQLTVTWMRGGTDE